MPEHPVWKICLLIALIVVPGSLLLLPLWLAHRKFVQQRLAAVPRSLDGCDASCRQRHALKH